MSWYIQHCKAVAADHTDGYDRPDQCDDDQKGKKLFAQRADRRPHLLNVVCVVCHIQIQMCGHVRICHRRREAVPVVV